MGTYLANFQLPLIKAAALLALALFASLAASGSLIGRDDLIVTAASIDLLITVPVVYWLFIRKSSIPNVTVFPVFLACVLTGKAVTTAEQGWLFDVAVFYVIPGLELIGLGYVGVRAFRIRRAYLEADPRMDMMERYRFAFTQNVNPLFAARAAAFEAGVFALVFFKWRRRPSTDSSFTYHKRSGAAAVLCVFLFILGAETVVLHFLIHQWSVTAAWIASALSIYLAFQIAAHFKGVLLRPIAVGEAELRMRCGIIADAAIPFSDIQSAALVDGKEAPSGSISITPLGTFSPANVRILLSEPVTVNGIYGTVRQSRAIDLFVDEPDRFIKFISDRADKI